MENKIRQPIVTVCGHVDHGKCVTGDTLIPLVDGTLISAKELFDKYYNKTKAKLVKGDIIQKNNKIELFSNYNNTIIPARTSYIWKRKKGKLIEIKTAHGDIIQTTPEHPYFKFPGSSKDKINAKDIQIGDYIAIPKKIKIKDTSPKNILIKELKNSDFLCFLNSKSKRLIEKIKKKGIKKIEDELLIKHLANSIKKSRIRIKNLVKICNYFKISDKQLYDMIDSIKNSSEKQRAGHTSKQIKLPDLHEPEKIGYILGCIAGDGHLAKTRVLLDNNDKEIQEKYKEYLKDLFNIDSYIKQNHTCQTVVNNAGYTFKKFLTEIIKFPDKNKSAKIEVPKIAQKNKEVFKGFFAGLVDTDGYVSHINNSIELTSKSKLIIKQCSILLLNLGIQSVVFSKKDFSYLRIANKKYLNKFLDNINIRHKKKLKRIISAYEKAQSSRIFDIFPFKKEDLKALKLVSKPNKKIPYFDKYLKYQKFSEAFLLKVLENVKEKNSAEFKIKSIVESDLRYVKIISKKEIKNKEKYVYDFTVPETSNFIAERTILHNTSLLDSLRDTCVQEKEAGGITQKISFTSYPIDKLKKACPLIEKSKIKLNIPGFLFIDTPGHAAFTNLRKRGGSLADLAVLVIDINEGIKPQTAETIQILKLNKIPFIIALNKIDNISGWRNNSEKGLKEVIESQLSNVKQIFDQRYMTLIASLNSYGFEADLFYNIQDFSKKIALIPCSAINKQGISELIMVLCGLSEKYLSDKLKLSSDAKGVILEIKKDSSSNYIEAILYDGKLEKNSEIAIANLDIENKGPIITKIRILEEIEPLCSKYTPKQSIIASTGFRMQISEKTDITPGMPFIIYKNNKQEINSIFKKEISDTINSSLSNSGIIAKADSLGSLEALLELLKQQNIKVVKAGIGKINKTDIISGKANLEINELDAIVIGFNVSIEPEAEKIAQDNKIPIFTDDVIYKLIENLVEFRKEKSKEIEKKRLLGLSPLCHLEILSQYVFRNTKPAIFGIRIKKGKLIQYLNIIDEKGNKIGKIKNIQSENKSVQEANEGAEVAISIPGINFERTLKNINSLYTDISEKQFRNFKKNKDLLSSNEIKILQEIAEIKRQKNPNWGN